MSKQISMPYEVYQDEIQQAKDSATTAVWNSIAKLTEVEVFPSHVSYSPYDCRIKFKGDVVDLILKLRSMAGYPEPPCRPELPK